MPHALKRPCRHPGCPGLTDDRSGYCPDHKKQERQRQDRERGSAASRGYGRRWQVASKRFLREHPLCAECERQGEITAAVLVDHIVPHRGNAVLFWDEQSNWQSLCTFHHNLKTASQDGGFGRPCNNKGG